jgi:DNA-binding response OmpR family regulator
MILPKKIIIVEDELITQRYIRNSIEDMGIEVVGCCDNAKDTLLITKSVEFDMILMDINIRGAKDGIILAKEILRDKNIPILFISAYNDDETLEEILEFSSDGFVSKPFTSRELEIAVKISYKAFKDKEKNLEQHNYIEKEIILNKVYRFSFINRELYHYNKLISLTPKQIKLIELLLKNRHHTVSTEEIAYTVWESDSISSSTIRTLIYSLRKILPSIKITNHSKMGYSIEV